MVERDVLRGLPVNPLIDLAENAEPLNREVVGRFQETYPALAALGSHFYEIALGSTWTEEARVALRSGADRFVTSVVDWLESPQVQEEQEQSITDTLQWLGDLITPDLTEHITTSAEELVDEQDPEYFDKLTKELSGYGAFLAVGAAIEASLLADNQFDEHAETEHQGAVLAGLAIARLLKAEAEVAEFNALLYSEDPPPQL